VGSGSGLGVPRRNRLLRSSRDRIPCAQPNLGLMRPRALAHQLVRYLRHILASSSLEFTGSYGSKCQAKVDATVPHTIRVRQTPIGRFDVFINHGLEHSSIRAFWLQLVLADNGITNYKYRDLMRRVSEFGEATETSTEKPPNSLRKLLFR